VAAEAYKGYEEKQEKRGDCRVTKTKLDHLPYESDMLLGAALGSELSASGPVGSRHEGAPALLYLANKHPLVKGPTLWPALE
jgi:hypothetical protein